MDKKERRIRWLKKSMDCMLKGGKTYRWFEIKLAKEMKSIIKPRKVEVLPLP